MKWINSIFFEQVGIRRLSSLNLASGHDSERVHAGVAGECAADGSARSTRCSHQQQHKQYAV